MTPIELRRRGLSALQRELGFVGMIRFLQQFDRGHGDYAKERYQWLGNPGVEDLIAQIKARREAS